MDWFAWASRVAFCHGKTNSVLLRQSEMTAAPTACPRGSTGYRMEQLASAFDRVRDSRDWKAPIRAVIPSEDRPVVEQAVLWFTETVPSFESVPGEPDQLVVRAVGYRLGPAGDPAPQREASPSYGVGQ